MDILYSGFSRKNKKKVGDILSLFQKFDNVFNNVEDFKLRSEQKMICTIS